MKTNEPDVISFARAELARCLSAMGCGTDAVDRIVLGLAADVDKAGVPHVADCFLDDAIHVRLAGGTGFVAGTNPRAVLIGVYRLLRELGCRWVRPDAEEIPPIGADGFGRAVVEIREAAAHRHRGVCIEGAVGREHVLDMIAWLPKAGFNSYFIQFRDAFTFYDRWYRHLGNPLLKPEPFDRARAAALTAEAAAAAKRAGLLYHAVGHGWTCEAVGIPGLSWDPQPEDFGAETRELLAEVGGRRGLFKGIALNTNLCYGNPVVRERMMATITDYAAAHPEVDYLHVWLADDVNNQCECPLCRNNRPSDLYVKILNAVDHALTARGLSTRIVLLCYLDLLWPPERERLVNPSRFALMFAPISRSFEQPLPAKATTTGTLPDFQRNRIKLPRDIGENLAFFEAWRASCPDLDTFDFDYHLMWAHYRDLGHRHIAHVLAGDAVELQSHGLNGLISCQVQRLFLPTSLGMGLLGRVLWNPHEPATTIEAEWLEAEFGPAWTDAKEILEFLSLHSGFDWFQQGPQERGDHGAVAGALDRIPGTCGVSAQLADSRASEGSAIHRRSWGNLALHLRLCAPLARALACMARGELEPAAKNWSLAQEAARQAEFESPSHFDYHLFAATFASQVFSETSIS